MENPIKMDDLGVPLFVETPICLVDSKILKLTFHVEFKGSNPFQCEVCPRK